MGKFKITFLTVITGLLLLFFSSLAQADLKDGLVAYYPFNGNANDESGNGNHGVVNGANLTEDRFGNAKSAYSFDTNNYIKIDNSSIFQFGDNALTLCAWFKAPEGSSYRCILGKQASSGGYGGFVLRVNEDGKFQFFASYCGSSRCGSLPEHSAFSPIRIDDELFHHAVGVRLATGELKLYIDGEYVGSSLLEIPNLDINNTNPLFIGTQNIHHDYSYKGIVDEVRIYNRALSESEIQELYREGELTDDRYEEGYEAGKQYCINNPEACGISVSGGCNQSDLDAEYQSGYNAGCSACSNGASTPVTLSPGLDMHIPVLQYETLLGTMNLWADFEFAGESSGDLIWKLSDFGQE
ncbi:exported hypothetical protein [Desulfamplus magnetovallimortis]|uniref:LamG-like jellyroll fold domain-containing protein n=1 Tax=Desulfamplus magnetovallimortis TaxID=1246637 RepID=A0A1W1H8H8_9BACT|nr:LamG domain-containing protein [Desulfamplus magnetovallimortis]SLM28771.1 exported hypothetical protein [Desulfamplus magnetovallimortis]